MSNDNLWISESSHYPGAALSDLVIMYIWECHAGKLPHKEPLYHDPYASADLDNGGSITHLNSSGLMPIAYRFSSWYINPNSLDKSADRRIG